MCKELLLLHGLGQTPEDWSAVCAALPDSSSVRCPALFALPRSGALTYDALYRAFCALCDDSPAPLSLCGLSLGAILALHYGLEHPGRVGALALAAPQYKMPRTLMALQNILFRLMPARTFSSLGLPKTDLLCLTRSMASLDFTDRLDRLTCPTLILCGDRDKANRAAAETLAAQLSQAEFYLVPQAGHELNRDAPAALASRLAAFFQLQ